MLNGYEYELFGGVCHKSGRPRVSPRAWHGYTKAVGAPGQSKPASAGRAERPIYNTCICCPQKHGKK